MSIQGRMARWRYCRKMAKIDRECRKRGHYDFGCYSVTGSIGDRCQRCRRILWTWADGKELDPPIYQEPTRISDRDW